jgi:hypothetical protein
MDTQQQFTLAHIEWLMAQGSQDIRWQHQRLRELQRTIQRQQKELRIFFLTVDALQSQYGRQQHTNDQLNDRLTDDYADHAHTLQTHKHQQKRDEQQLGQMEKQLQQLRHYAIQRRNKKAKRERQYHEVYHVPLVNIQYKKKYMRARDKNDAVEQQLSELHHGMDLVKERLRYHRQQGTAVTEQQQDLDNKRLQLADDSEHLKQLMTKMKQAQSFWCQFDVYHIQPCLDMLKQQQWDDGLWTQLRLASVDYEDTELYGRHHWNHTAWDVKFECTHCRTTATGWPCLDKVRTTQLLCQPCYKDTRTSMIVEKKLGSLGAYLSPTNDQQQPSKDRLRLSALSTSSSVSIPSLISSTSKSTHSIINECKPFVKKMKSALAMNQQHKDTLHPLLV